jgi:type II secretory pathway pseudopilin PulG
MLTALRTGLRRAARESGGFTIIELMVAATVGILVLLVAFALLDASSQSYTRVDTRLDGTQRARRAMDWFERSVRSQACPDQSTPALMEATSSSVTLWTDFGGANFNPVQHKLELTSGKLVDSTLTGAYPSQVVSSAQTLATKIGLDGTTPLFRYYAFQVGAGGNPTLPTLQLNPQANGMLSAADLKKVVRVSIAFAALPIKYTTSNQLTTVLQNDIDVRTADPSDPTGPKCA